MTFKSHYPFKCILKYIPKRYTNLKDWQLANQKAVCDFKNGKISPKYKLKILNAVKEVAGPDTSDCILCFIPASTRKRHFMRYGELSRFLQENLDFPVMLDAIVGCDRDSVHLKEDLPHNNEILYDFIFNVKFENKRVILFDDVITTGKSLSDFGFFLKESGASSVYGVIFAMTIHPNLPFTYKNKKPMRK